MSENSFFIKKSDIARSFSEAAKTYDQHAFIQHEVGKRLFERLDILKKPPKTILDVGAGTGLFSKSIQQKFPKAQVFGVDIAFGMCQVAAKSSSSACLKNTHFLCSDAEFLPFKKGSIDLIFSNLTLQWCFHLKATLKEFKRVLKPEGMIFFSTLGPDTLQELRQSFAHVDDKWHVNPFSDMHDIGDILLNLQFQDPVMDREMITLTYQSVHGLLKDLKATGARNMNTYRQSGLTTPSAFRRMAKAYEKFKKNNVFPASFEVLYGHALMRGDTTLYRQEADGTIHIPGDYIPIL